MRLAARWQEKSLLVTNFAATILQRLTAPGTDRAAFTRQCVAEFDRDGDGNVAGEEFQHVFATLQRIDQMTGGATSSFVSSGCRPTLFEVTLYPSYSTAYAVSAYQANAMLDELDMDGDNAVSAAEWLGEAKLDPETPDTPPTETETSTSDPVTPPPPTPDERATELLAAYDITGKGYITIDDIISKWLADPSLGDIANAGNAIEAWDANGDGKVTRDDIVSAYEMMDAADRVVTALGDPTTGRIALDNLSQDKLAALELTDTQLKAWDSDQDGALSRNEVLDGLKVLQIAAQKDAEAAAFQTLVQRYDSNTNGSIDPNELINALGGVTLDEASVQSTFAAWDLDGNQQIDAAELQKGYSAIKDAQATIAAYDIAGKGYFDLADLERVIAENPADGQASASDILAAWDRDGDGKVSVQDVLTMKQAMTQAAATTTENSV